MENKNAVHGLGATFIDKKAYLFFCTDRDLSHGTFTVREGEDGLTFSTITQNAKVIDVNGPADELGECNFVHISKDGKYNYLTYRLCDSENLSIARSKNFVDWEKFSSTTVSSSNGKIVSEYLYAGRNVMVTGGDTLRMYVSEDLKSWTRVKKDLVALDESQKNSEIIVVEAQVVDDGVFVMYAISKEIEGVLQYELHGTLLEYGDPTRIKWQSSSPIYVTENSQENQTKLFGVVTFDDYFVSYWTDGDGNMFLIRHFYSHDKELIDENEADITDERKDLEGQYFTLEKHEENPIIAPQEHTSWESLAAYNPTAIEHDGTIHIIYRADGNDLKSVWGYASTVDGVTIKDRSPNFIYQRKTETFKMPFPPPVSYTSGNNGGGGCEDPRAVLIDGVIYVTFTAFDGWHSVRVALTSISIEDFLNHKWNWKQTKLISPPGEMNKNWVIFPEKINGKFAVMHSYVPEILVDYFDNLDELGGDTFINSNNTRPIEYDRGWDSWFRGIGPAPLKTSEGWLVFYHAMDHRNPDRYRLGALLLDLNDPTIELCRSKGPILEPEEHYENNGHKWGVVYSCGAVIKDDTIFVYYGGADKFVCVATAPLEEFLKDLKTGEVKMLIR